MSGLDLYQTQRALALLFVNAALGGFLFGGVYDLLRALRMMAGDLSASRQGRRPFLLRLLLFWEDLLFMLLWTVGLILLCYYQNDGQLRAPAILGMAGGFFVYMQTVSRLTLPLTRWGVAFLRRSVGWILRLSVRPLRWIGRQTLGRAVRAYRERVTEAKISALTRAADNGFGLGDADNQKHPPA